MVKLASCWAGLPFHLLYDLIEQTTDPKSLQNWSIATKKNERLHHFVLQTQWRETSVGQRDFLSEHPQPGRQPLSRTRIGKMSRVLYPDRRLLRPTLAEYIERLTLDFHFTSDSVRFQVLQPCYEDVENGLEALIPRLTRVSEITFNGSLYTGLFKQLATIKSDKLRILRLRDRFPEFSLWRTERPKLTDDDLAVKFVELAAFKSLRVLEIRELQHIEGMHLANAVHELKHLEKLHVEAASDIGPRRMTRLVPESWVGYGESLRNTMSPLGFFMSGIFPGVKEDRPVVSCKLPRTLRSLALVDGYARTTWVNEPMPADSSYPFLTDVCIGLDQRDEVVGKILTWLQAPITRLTIPSERNFFYHPCPPKEADPSFQTYLDRIIPQGSTVKQLTLLNLWDSHLQLTEDLENECLRSFIAQELVLGTEPKQYYFKRRSNRELNTISKRLQGSQEHCAKLGRWGTNIRRMRIEDVPRSDSYFSDFANPSLDNLKVLVIALCSAHRSEVESDLLVERPIAEQIAAQKFPNLRIITVRAARFWLQREKPTRLSLEKSIVVKIWRLSEALSDPEQRLEINRCLDDDDWRFMDGDVPHSPEPLVDFQRFDAGMYARSNYMVLHRKPSAPPGVASSS